MSLGVYVHLPFCRTHCSYCAFAISTDLGREVAYVDALEREIRASSPGAGVESIYFGGGTPSRTSIENLQRIIDVIGVTHEVAPDAEFSMEANPEDITATSIAAWQAIGVNRLSIGVQSFHDRELVPLGRIHGADRAREAVTLAVASGLRTNLDLILGLPGQTNESFAETLDTAVFLGAGHLSLYMLDLEEKSPLAVQVERGRAALPEENTIADLYIAAIERLASAGLQQYEISNFARAGEECRHNLRYWTRGHYRGFGLGAHSFIGERRFANTRDIRKYIEQSPQAGDFSEAIGESEAKRETLLLGLRQTSGIIYEDLARLCGQEGIAWIDRGLRDGWLRRADGRVAFTPSGFLVSNELISQLF
jgi:oxygen-independent coproporphyrinogen III oxidase